jgi:serine/threonine protein kinase
MIGLLEGVQYIHSKGLIFKDLKIENIIIDDEEGK